MIKFLSQLMAGTSFDQTGDISRQRIGIGLDEEMDMIGLNSKLDNLPVVFVRHLFNNLLQPIMDRTNQHFSPTLGAEDDVIEKMVNRMLFVNVVFAHVGEYSRHNLSCQQTGGVSTPPLPSNN